LNCLWQFHFFCAGNSPITADADFLKDEDCYWFCFSSFSLFCSDEHVPKVKFPENEYDYLKALFDSANERLCHNKTNGNFEDITVCNPCLQNWYGHL
jgi:hypothetical protein